MPPKAQGALRASHWSSLVQLLRPKSSCSRQASCLEQVATSRNDLETKISQIQSEAQARNLMSCRCLRGAHALHVTRRVQRKMGARWGEEAKCQESVQNETEGMAGCACSRPSWRSVQATGPHPCPRRRATSSATRLRRASGRSSAPPGHRTALSACYVTDATGISTSATGQVDGVVLS